MWSVETVSLMTEIIEMKEENPTLQTKELRFRTDLDRLRF